MAQPVKSSVLEVLYADGCDVCDGVVVLAPQVRPILLQAKKPQPVLQGVRYIVRESVTNVQPANLSLQLLPVIWFLDSNSSQVFRCHS